MPGMTMREGYLMKHGSSKLKVWQKRWFVLDVDAGLLTYYLKHTNVTPDKALKQIDLRAGADGNRAHVITSEADSRSLPPSLLQLYRALSDFDFLLFVSAESGLHLRTASIDERLQWVHDLDAASGNGDGAGTPTLSIANLAAQQMAEGLDHLHSQPHAERRPLRFADSSGAMDLNSVYDITDTLGQGAVDGVVVRLGRHRGSGEPVAIKEIPKRVLTTERQKETTRREIEIMMLVAARAPADLAVVKLYAIVETATMIYICMELVEGGELFDHIVEAGAYDERKTRRVMRRLLEALSHLHSIGIIHRDIKPENILCDADGLNVKIADFGLSNSVSPAQASLRSQCGTPVYMAPEMLQKHPYGPSVDVWSAGIVMYITLSGSMPFYAENPRVRFALVSSVGRRSPPCI